jgi:hypothetical protein
MQVEIRRRSADFISNVRFDRALLVSTRLAKTCGATRPAVAPLSAEIVETPTQSPSMYQYPPGGEYD